MIGEYSKQHSLPFTAASAVNPHTPVALDTGAVKRQVIPVATSNIEPIGLSGAATALQGEAVTIYLPGAVVEAVAVASIGAGANVAAAPTGVAVIAGASGSTHYRVGRTLEPAGEGEHFALAINPEQLSNLA